MPYASDRRTFNFILSAARRINLANRIIPYMGEIVNMEIGKIIKECRTSQHLTQTEVAKQSGLSLSTVHGIESGENKEPSFKKIAAICKVLNLSLDELYEKATRELK